MTEEQEEQSFDEAFEELANPSEENDDFFADGQEEEHEETEEVVEEEASTPSPEERLAALEQERDDWKHKFESNQGRVAAIQREYNDLKQNVGSTEEAPTKQQVEDATDSDESWKEFAEDFPEFAEALSKRLNKITEDYERKLDERVGGIKERLEKEDTEKSQKIFDETMNAAHEGWRETVKTAEFQAFLEAQPKSIQQLYYSADPEDGIYLLDQFSGKKETNTDDLKKKRENRLKRNVSAPRSGPGGRTGPPDDFDSAWDYYARK